MSTICTNKYLFELTGESGSGDFLYHLGLGTNTHDLPSLFGDVRFVCMGGSASRMEKMAKLIRSKLNPDAPDDELEDLAIKGGRYSMFKVGPVLCVNHNIGASTLSVVLHEIFKLLNHAKVKKENIHIIRLGTSGGIGVEPGTVVVTNKIIDSVKRTMFHSSECGKVVTLPCMVNQEKADEICATGEALGIRTMLGGTMGADDFYLGQGRLDGAFLSYNSEDKFDFLQDIHDNYGIRNIEMEAHILSAFTHRVGVNCSIICVTLLNRLNGDQVETPIVVGKYF